VGDFCSVAMEQGFGDACLDLCMGKIPVSRLSHHCRAASMEMPRPTVRRWCEHGYSTAFAKTKKELATTFVVSSDAVVEPEASVPEEVETAEDIPEKKLVATLPITLDDKIVDLEMYEGDSAEESVLVFCKTYLGDDISGCVRELLPSVLQRLEEDTK